MASGLKAILSQAERLARRRSQPLTSAHVLLALYQRTGVGELLEEQGVSELGLLGVLSSEGEEHGNLLALALERAERSALVLRQARAGVWHLLLALAREPRSLACQYLERMGVAPLALQDAVLARLDARAHAPAGKPLALQPLSAAQVGRARMARPRRVLLSHRAQQRLAAETEGRRARDRAQRRAEPAAAADPAPACTRIEAQPAPAPAALRRLPRAETAEGFELDAKRFPLLTALGRNLCSAAAQGLIDPVLGRDAEIEQVLDVLSRRRANNPVLVGPPGVGKTAIALGVALRLARGQARGLECRVLIELSAAALVAGTSVRGALSERLQAVAQEVALSEGRVLLFIDEVHTLVSAEDGADTLTGGLKAALARGELPCIGATTDAEYRRIFERDAALARRFTRVDVGEPTQEATLAILEGIAPEYERHHGVAFAAGALRAAVELSVRFLSERHLPDKAVALLDQAGARVSRRGGACVDVEAIAEVVSEQAAVPLERLLQRDGDALLALEAHLERRVVGQRDAIAAIADALRKSAAGFRGARPLGTFLFLGPTGVGKTEMAKAISELLFPGSAITRLDMSELSEPHALARLIGSPPGYIGHEDGGQLTEPVRGRPYQLVLLDEVEKAHRDVLLALLPLLDEGRLTDGRGRHVDFKNTVVVMTSNLGVEPSSARTRVGFGAGDPAAADRSALKQRALASARQALPPELWNRIDEPLYFHALDRSAAALIAERMTDAVATLLAREHGLRVRFEPSALSALIAAGGYDPELGARPMRRTVGRLVEAPLARAILAGELEPGQIVVVRGRQDRIEFDREPDTPLAAE